jgi:hypothetical protein
MYILKIRGTEQVPDHVQIRDDDFSLVAYFRVTHPKTALAGCNLLDKTGEILEIIQQLEYGKMEKLEV